MHGDRGPRHLRAHEGRRFLNAPSNWFESFFSGLAVEFWQAVIPEEATAQDVAFLWKHLGLSEAMRVLDVPCGAGRLTLPLAARGCTLTGVDISAQFLEAARGAAVERGLTADWRQADMIALDWNGAFDAAFCFGNSFGYLDDAGNAAFLAAVGRALKPGGRFAIDYGQTAESIFPRLEARQEADMAGFHFAEETRYDMVSGRIENRFTFSRGGKTETKLASQRVYTVNEIVRLLAGAGFETNAFFGSPGEEPFVLGSHRLL
ncbi:MAG TPA: methyltransferase domain-containing protein, partial [Thermoanaerobaculia bacterium]|nr:methyltransferase domain-containing protein [Thermoanaerobaculia bacterium]